MRTHGKILAALLLALTSACTSNGEGDVAPPANVGPAASGVDISSAKADPDTWMSLSAKEHGFEARFPVAPKKQDESMPTLAGTIPAVSYMAEQGNEAVGVTVLIIPDALLGQFNVNGALDGGRDGMINNVGGTIVSETHLQFAGHEARAIVAKAAAADGTMMKLEARIFWASPRMYQLLAVSVEGAPSNPADKFFASFKLVE